MPAESIVPIYFGPDDRPLFGCYHQPRVARKCAVVVCQPVGHEYVNSHRALRRLAARLCGLGLPTLRFDYHGCGDSAGNAEDSRIYDWLDDIMMAIAETRARSGVDNICLIGLRLGAALSLIASEKRRDIGSLILWDPIVSGRNYLRELMALRKRMLRRRLAPSEQGSEYDTDVLGFPLSRLLSADLENLNLPALAGQPTRNVLFLQTSQGEDESCLQDYFRLAESPFEYQCLPAPQVWLPTEDGSLLVPVHVLQAIITWISKMCL